MTITEQNAHDLIAYATKHPKGFTREQAENDLGLDGNHFGAAKRKARRILAATGDRRALIVTPQLQYDPWLYQLTSDFDKARGYVANRLNDTETRLTSIEATAATLVAATDGRNLDGKKARKIRKVVSRLVEDLAEMNEASA